MSEFTESVFLQQDSLALKEIKSTPKGDLHTHMIFAAPFSVYRRLAGGKLKDPPQRFSGLSDFLNYLNQELIIWVRSVDDVLAVLRGSLEQMKEDGVVYSEMSFDFRLFKRFSSDELFAGFLEVLNSHNEIKVSPEIGIARELELAYWQSEIEHLLANDFFEGIDLYGQEDARDIQEFLPFLDSARKNGKRIKIHSGEIVAPAQIWADVKGAKPSSLQHGINSVSDPKLVEFLASNNISLNICPASNIALGICSDYKSHPISKLVSCGVSCTVATDDYTVFGVSVSQQYQYLFKSGALNPVQLEQMRKNSLPLVYGPIENDMCSGIF